MTSLMHHQAWRLKDLLAGFRELVSFRVSEMVAMLGDHRLPALYRFKKNFQLFFNLGPNG